MGHGVESHKDYRALRSAVAFGVPFCGLTKTRARSIANHANKLYGKGSLVAMKAKHAPARVLERVEGAASRWCVTAARWRLRKPR